MVISLGFRMGQYRDDDHREDAPRFNISKIFLPLSMDLVGYIIHVFQSPLSNHRNSYFWQMWLTQPIRLLPSFRKRMEILRNIYWTHHARFHHFDEVYTIQHERNALKFMIRRLPQILQNLMVPRIFHLRTLLYEVLLTFGTIF